MTQGSPPNSSPSSWSASYRPLDGECPVGERLEHPRRHGPALDDAIAGMDEHPRHPDAGVLTGEHHRRPARVEVARSRLDDGVAHGDGPSRRSAQR